VCGSRANSVQASEIQENFASVAKNSKDLAYSVGSLLHSVGSEVIHQTQKLGSSISSYVASLQQPESGILHVSIQENPDNVTVIINGLENVDTTACCQAKLMFLESLPPIIKAIIQINPDTVVTLSCSYGYNNLSIDIVTTSKQTAEENKDAGTIRASSSKQQKIVKTITTKYPIDLQKLTIDLHMAQQEMVIVIPHTPEKEKVVPVNIK